MIKSNKAANLATSLGLGGAKPKPKAPAAKVIPGREPGKPWTKDIKEGEFKQVTTTGFKPGKGPVKPANSIKNPGNVVGFGGIGNKEVNSMYRNTGIVLK